MQTYGFVFRGYLNGQREPILRTYTFADTETLTKGDPLNIESGDGEVDLFASGGDTGFIGVANETKTGTSGVTEIEVIWDMNGQAIWAVTDANARVEGANLDITGMTGAMTVGADSDSDVVVIANSAADEPTLVRSHPRARGDEAT